MDQYRTASVSRASLQKEAGQVLWDYGTEVTNSLKKLTKILKD